MKLSKFRKIKRKSADVSCFTNLAGKETDNEFDNV